MKLKKCRVCKTSKFNHLFSLGNLSFTGKFAKTENQNIKKEAINLIKCKKCSLVQLDRNFNSKFLYGKDYGYRTGINKTMTNHVKDIVGQAKKIVKLKKGDNVLDIASNDGTLLNFYGKEFVKVGIDPILNKYKKFYKKINHKIPNFFSSKALKKTKIKKFKVITALSVFYDLKNPNSFIKDVKLILDREGVFILEHADLHLILKNNLFDTICHEHLEYYSSKVIKYILSKHKLEIFDHYYNDVNGGSSLYFISHKNSKFKNNETKINKILSLEKKSGLEKTSTYKNFFRRINLIKKKILEELKKIKKSNKIIHGYGASTKGNVLLQFFDIDKKYLNLVADRNPDKYNLYTPGTKFKIISEKSSRSQKPDYYLVLPWHFKKEILKREISIRKKGTKFIFPLPKIQIL